jgi:hypothetical protein
VLVRGTPGLSVIAVLVLAAVALMWLPQARTYFRLTDPKPAKKKGPPGS